MLKKLQQFIREARKNPELNPKISVNQEVEEHLSNAKPLFGTKIMNSFVSFTQIGKLGINPKSPYETPIGIYAYDSQYVKSMTEGGLPMSSLPFAGNSKYANIFSIRGNVVYLNNMSKADLKKYATKIVDIFATEMGAKKKTEEWEYYTNYAKDLIDRIDKSIGQPNGLLFWYYTMDITSALIGDMADLKDGSPNWKGTKHPIAWTKLFLKLKIDGFVDSGDGIIHPNEPRQSVFFSRRVVDKNKLVYNKYSPKSFKASVLLGKIKKREAVYANKIIKELIKSEDWDGLIRSVKNDSKILRHFMSSHRKSVPKKVLRQIEVEILKDPEKISYIRKPPEYLQVILVKKNPENIRFIKNQSEKAKKIAVYKDYRSILYVNKPSIELQMFAANKKPYIITNPFFDLSPEVEIAVVEKTPKIINYLEKPSKKSIKLAKDLGVEYDYVSPLEQ